jgi:hypothetical protein
MRGDGLPPADARCFGYDYVSFEERCNGAAHAASARLEAAALAWRRVGAF